MTVLSLAEDNPSGLGALTVNLRLPGQYFDSETGLHYNYFRDYDPQTGRYIQSDPIGLAGGSMSLYTYVDSDPVSTSDPDGLQKRGGAPQPSAATSISNAYANATINQIQQLNPNFSYPPNLTAPGQGGYTPRDVEFLQAVLARTRACLQCSAQPTLWPSGPQRMNQLLGNTGTRTPDGPYAGRGRIDWVLPNGGNIRYEQHPYHPTAPTFHCGPHWHLDLPGQRPHQTFVPGDVMPPLK